MIDQTDKEIYKEEVEKFVQRKLNLRQNVEKAYGFVWDQCSAELQAYIKGLQEYPENFISFNTIWLLKELKKATSGVNSKANAWANMHDVIASLYRINRDHQNQTNII